MLKQVVFEGYLFRSREFREEQTVGKHFYRPTTGRASRMIGIP